MKASLRTHVKRAPWVVLILSLLLAVSCPAWAQGMIPPGREGLVSEMLQGTAPAECTFKGALIAKDRIKARYDCGLTSQAVVIELRHPSDNQGQIAGTERFSVHVSQGSPPPTLLDRLTARLREREAGWTWPPLLTPDSPKTSSGAQGTKPTKPAAPWFFLAAIACLVTALRRSPRIARTDLLVALSLGIASLIARLGLGAWGPFHANGQGPLWVFGAAWDASRIADYGPGYAELFAPLAQSFPVYPDYALFAANAVLSACVPVALYCIARLCALDPLRASLAAALLLVDPVSLRLAATESYLATISFFVAAATCVWALGALRFEERDYQSAGLFALSGALLTAQALRIHPFAWVPAALVPCVVYAVQPTAPWLSRLRRTALAYALCAVVVLLTQAMVLWTVGAHAWNLASRVGALQLRWATLLEPTVLALLAGLLLTALAAKSKHLLLPAALALVALACTHHFHSQTWIQHAALQRLYAPLLLLGLVSAVPKTWLERRTARVFAFAAVVALLVLRLPLVRARTTEHAEYKWLRPKLAALAPSCLVAYVPRAGNKVLYLPEYAAPGRSAERPLTVQVAQGQDLLNPFLAGQCAYVFHSSLCSTAAGNAPCHTLEDGLPLREVSRASLPAVPTHDDEPYLHASVEVVLWHLPPAGR